MSFPAYPEYKQSGVHWLGSIPGTWDTQRVKSLFEIRKRIARQEGYDVLSITQKGLKVKDVDSNEGQLAADYSNYQFVEPGDFAMNHMDLLTGWIDVATVSGVTSPDYRVFSPRDPTRINPRYFLHIFQTAYREKILYASGQGASQLGRWRLPAEQFNEFVLPFPPLGEQDTIASVLDSATSEIDSLIRNQRRLIELLKEKRQAVISHAVTKGLNPGAPMKPSDIEWLGDVPTHWKVERIKFVLESVKAGPFGSALTKDVYVESGFRVYGQEQVIPNDFTIGDYYISPQKYEELSQYSVSPGDVLISCVGTFGKIAIVPRNAEPGIINPRLIRVRCSAAIMPEYLVEFMRSNLTFEQFVRVTRGGTMDVINIGTLNGLFIAVPPIAEQEQILGFIQNEVSKFDVLITETVRVIDLLRERRSALISAAVTGKIDVRQAVAECMA
jgi:type I restriction enzyme S subunit